MKWKLLIVVFIFLVSGCATYEYENQKYFQCFNGKLYEMVSPVYGVQVNYHIKDGAMPCQDGNNEI